MAGALTKLGIATGLFTMVFVVFLYVMVSLGNDYSVSIESTYVFSDTYSDFEETSSRYLELSDQATVNQQVQDLAQLQGKTSAAESQMNWASIVKSSFEDFQKIFPIHPIVFQILGAILIIITLSAGTYLLFGRVP
jgi:hypothetical protein